jgi:hypothetical protein
MAYYSPAHPAQLAKVTLVALLVYQPDVATGGVWNGQDASRPPSGHDLLVIVV